MQDAEGNLKTESQSRGSSAAGASRMLDMTRPMPRRRWVFWSLVVFALLVSCTVFAWLLLRQIDQRHMQDTMKSLAGTLEQKWSETMLRVTQPTRTICDEIESGAIVNAQHFSERALSFRRSQDAYEAMFWISQDSAQIAEVDWDGNEPSDVLPYNAEVIWQQLRRRSGGTRPLVGPVYESGYGRGLVMLYFPVGIKSEHGAVVAVLRTSQLLEQIADEEMRDLVAVTVVRDDQVIYRSGEYFVEPDPSLRQVRELQFIDQRLTCQIMPRAQFIQQYRSLAPAIALGVGVLACLGASTAAVQTMRRRWRYSILEQGQLQVIDIMSELVRSVSTGRGELARSMEGVLASAQLTTNCDVVALYRITDRKRLELLSRYGDLHVSETIEMGTRAADLLADLLAGGTVAVSGERHDARAECQMFCNDIQSMMLSILHAERMMGVMVFGSRQRGAWSAGRQSLVKLWATQTAAIMSDEAIHEQMRDALGVQEKLAQRREMMLTLLGEIYQAGSIEGMLSHIAQYSPRSLGIEACVVLLRNRQGDELEVVAATGDLGVRFFGYRLRPTGEQLVWFSRTETATVVQPDDIAAAGFGKLVEPWMAGIAYVPMAHSDGRPIGCLLLMSASQYGFTNDQIDLSRVLASRAAAAIENARLNQQIRRDAESRAMLLRELNHRVKNNLAGIVGLLSMSSNMEMPDNVRQWLNRVVERIGTIARAHELFSGGMTTVNLSSLVEQVIPSLAVVKPAGVEIVKDLGGRDISLKTSQAVSVAMVMHELCYNAIIHGLGARGTLTIRTGLAGRNVVLDIVDDGTAGSEGAEEGGGVATAAKISTGMGLQLVKGLVGRELHGRFLMRRRSEGGTIVTVEFPLEREERESAQ